MNKKWKQNATKKSGCISVAKMQLKHKFLSKQKISKVLISKAFELQGC